MKYILIIASTLTLVACAGHHQPQMPEPQLTVATAVERAIPTTVEFISVTQPLRSYTIQPRVNGFLRSINFSSGTMVKQGQVIYTIDPAPFQTDVAQARAALSSAKASFVDAQSNYNRSVPLARLNAISSSQLDAATASYAAAREQVASAQAVLDNALINLSYCTIKAPDNGFIAPSSASVGEYVGAGTPYQTLTTISVDDSVSVDLSLPTQRYYNIIANQPADYKKSNLVHDITLRLSDGTIYPDKGTYIYTNPGVDPQSGSIVFNVRFPNKQALLRGGQFARVTASIGAAQRRVVIPARAVSEVQGVYGAYVVDKDDTLEFRKITVGDTEGSDWVVLSGIAVGEKVITDGLLKAKSGMKIKIKK